MRYRRIQGVKVKERNLKNELDKLRLNQEIEIRSRQLTQLALDIKRRRDFNETLVQKLKDIKKKISSDMYAPINDVIIFSKNELDIDQSIYHLQQDVTKINFEFFENLNKKYPGLSKGERNLCGLLRLNLNNNEIAVLRGISPESIKVAKNRLRRKLELPQRGNLHLFLKNI
jgi:DNA-binding CsgD family transcriptional regulator